MSSLVSKQASLTSLKLASLLNVASYSCEKFLRQQAPTRARQILTKACLTLVGLKKIDEKLREKKNDCRFLYFFGIFLMPHLHLDPDFKTLLICYRGHKMQKLSGGLK